MNKKLAFFHFPRTGGSFLGYYIREYLNDEILGLGHYRYIDREKEVGDLPTCCFIRNPFDWYVSSYFCYARPVQRTEAGLLKDCDAGLWGDEFLKRFPDFNDWISWGFENVSNFSMTNCFNQLCTKDGRLMINIVGKFEYMQVDFIGMLADAGISIPDVSLQQYKERNNDQKHLNNTIHKPFQEYYNNKSIFLVNQFDYYLITEFNYKF